MHARRIAGAPDCSGQVVDGVDDLRRLDDGRAWNEHTNVPDQLRPTYCQARREVDAWMGRFGKRRLLALLEEVRRGGSFYDLYGPWPMQGAAPR